MKRISTGMLVAALAVAISFSMATTASASEPATAHTSAKSKKAAAKDKKRANAKAKAKARQRARARARTNKCKPKKRGMATKRGKAKAKKSAVKKKGKRNCKKAKKKPAKSKGGSGLADGLYSDAAKNVKVQISGKGSTVAVTFSLLNPIPREYTFTAPANSTGSKLSASQTESTLGGSGSLNWSLTVNTRTLSYKLDIKENIQFPEQNPTMTEDSVSGTLKAG